METKINQGNKVKLNEIESSWQNGKKFKLKLKRKKIELSYIGEIFKVKNLLTNCYAVKKLLKIELCRAQETKIQC